MGRDSATVRVFDYYDSLIGLLAILKFFVNFA